MPWATCEGPELKNLTHILNSLGEEVENFGGDSSAFLHDMSNVLGDKLCAGVEMSEFCKTFPETITSMEEALGMVRLEISQWGTGEWRAIGEPEIAKYGDILIVKQKCWRLVKSDGVFSERKIFVADKGEWQM